MYYILCRGEWEQVGSEIYDCMSIKCKVNMTWFKKIMLGLGGGGIMPLSHKFKTSNKIKYRCNIVDKSGREI